MLAEVCHSDDVFTYPCDEDVLGQTSVGVLDFDKGKLDPAFGEVFDEINQFAL